MELSQIGEFGLIERIKKLVGIQDKGVVVGIGDDSAILRLSPGRLLLCTSDTLIEGVHFDLDMISPKQLGKRAMVTNLSDIAGMGGAPRYAMISVGLTGKVSVEFVDEIFRGLKIAAQSYKVSIVGGDTVHSPSGLIISIAILGEIEEGYAILRSGARPGDEILVTGDIGASEAGLATLKAATSYQLPDARKGRAIEKHLTPVARVKEGRIIAQRMLATSMIDISDGLVGDINHVCNLSRVGAKIWQARIPISQETRGIARKLKFNPLDFALYGGEDFELLFTAPPEKAREAIEILGKETKTPVSRIGEITPRKEGIQLINSDGSHTKLEHRGYEHFKSGV
jgi:thiamine-monophosphate kinase